MGTEALTATGAQVLVAGLEAAGVEVVFGLPGVHNLAAWEALRESPIRLVGVRHEQAAAYAADGYARATGRLGVALVTTGPGAANTLGAVGEAWASRSAILVVATDIPTTVRRPGVFRGALHECLDQTAMFAPVTRHQWRAETAQELAQAMHEIGRLAGTPPTRPLYLEIPTDVLSQADERGPILDAPYVTRLGSGSDGVVLAAAVRSAKRPLIWVGGGARWDPRSGRRVRAVAERLGAPVLETYMGRGTVGPHHMAVGFPPHLPEVGRLWDEADLVLALGSDLDGTMTQNWRMPQPPRLVAVNVDPADATKNYEAELVIDGDVAEACGALIEALPAEPRASWADLDAVRGAARARLESEQPDELAFLDAFARAVPDDAVVVADMCIPGYWIGGFHRFAAPRKLIYPLGWGTLGCAFPQALGASLAGAGPVVSVSGDGGFLFACGELATMAQERLPLTAVIVDDGGYGMLRFDQRQHGRETYGVDLATPDFVALAQSFGVRAERVEGLTDAFADALARHVADPEPSVLVAHAALEPPQTTSPRWYRPA